MEYCLADVGIRPLNDEEEVSDEIVPINPYKPSVTSPPARFTYQCKAYDSLLDPAVNITALIRDVSRVPEYHLCERTNFWDASSIILGLFLRMPQNGEVFDSTCLIQRKRLMGMLFTEIEQHCFIAEELVKIHDRINDDDSPLSLGQFYEQLRIRHRHHQASTENGSEIETIKHSSLRPELRPYQQQAIRWLIERETIPATLPAQYSRLRNANVPEVDFYADLYTFGVLDTVPQPIPVPAGGILADEMGLGKTVEMLALLLLNRRPEEQLDGLNQQKVGDDNKPGPSTANSELMCLCMKTGRTGTIECHKCGRLQHRKCVLKHQYENPSDVLPRYLCPECWRTEPLVESGATIIVSPAAIKNQWASEIRKHISCPNFRLFLYNGVSEPGGSWISPSDLAAYDVVLTDYNILKTEIHFTSENMRKSRHEKRFLTLSSPLTMIRWWRVCLDEAQMVEGMYNNTAKMVKTLPAVYRWTVTGTPIEKTMNNLHGLVHFLDYAPYNNFGIWREFLTRYQTGNAEPLLTAMVRIMWRTCKASVLDQLGIPPQTVRVHYVVMSDLQRHFYRSEHAQCARAFYDKARRIERTLPMAKMNIQSLNQLMEPLRKLRHDCTIPSILCHANTLYTKKLLTPSELHEHLVTSNTNECKSQLRSMVSSMNGIAGVQILLKGYVKAMILYMACLNLANKYKTGTITVDSLLQIHTLHNFVELIRLHGNDIKHSQVPDAAKLRDYEESSTRLEWCYLEQYVSKVRAVETDLLPAIAKLEHTISQTDSNGLRLDGGWWRDFYTILQRDSFRSNELFYRLLTEIPVKERPPVDSWRGLDLWLTVWWDNITRGRRTLKQGFQELTFFVDNLKPKHLVSSAARASIDELVKTALACHLDSTQTRDRANKGQVEKNSHSPAPICLLCKVKRKLNDLEAVLFLTKGKAATGGLWQITYSELMLKQILMFAKRSSERMDGRILEEGDHCLAYLEHVKQEFKEYSRYWVELNYTVAAYDELNMCKSRIQLITLEQFRQMGNDGIKRTAQQLLGPELIIQIKELQQTKRTSEKEFLRLEGTLKYLAHLGQKTDIDPCPICRTTPDVKYAVLQCGHHFCSICAINMQKMSRDRQSTMSCVVCRHPQPMRDIQYVNLNATTSVRHKLANDDYSAKIQTIVGTVLDLKEQESDVKIVIFSHWEPILVKLEEALAINNICSRQKAYKSRNGVSDFLDPELGITCLLLPLRYGSKGLNLTQATHVFLVEPILNPGEELQAIGRIHRIGQTRPTFVHRFIVRNTIEETIYDTIQKDQSDRWLSKQVTVEHLEQLFQLKDEQDIF